MSTHKVSSIKIPPFDKEHYGLGKRCMLLFLRDANKKYIGILTKGVKTLMNVVFVHEEDGLLIPHRIVPKEPSEYTDEENDQLILVKSLDPVMNNVVVNCKNTK